MSILSKILALEPVDENIVKAIVQAVGLPTDKIDFAALGEDLAGARMNGQWTHQISSPAKVPPSKRRLHAEKVRSHAKKLLASLVPTDENDGRYEFWQLIDSRQKTQELPNPKACPKKFGLFLHFILLVIRDADQIISAADAEIQSSKDLETIRASSPSFAELHDLWSPPQTVPSIVAWDLAPIFEAHFGRKARASTPSQAAADRTPQGPFVQFVQAVQQHLKLFPDQESVSPHTIAQGLAFRKSRNAEQARADARVQALLQGDLKKNI